MDDVVGVVEFGGVVDRGAIASKAEIQGAQIGGGFAGVKRTIREEFAAIEEQDAPGDGRGFGEIVRGKKDGRLLATERAHGGPKLLRGGSVKAARGFVE